eukprot:gene2473-3216_t
MEQRALGRSGLSIAPLMLGGNVFGWTADEATSHAILDAFIAGGFNAIDTADVYSAWAPGNTGGDSEKVIGTWLKARGMRESLGPFSLSINEETGLLIKGHDTPPMLMMGHDRPYLAARIEALGYDKAKDVFAYLSDITKPLPKSICTLMRRPLPDTFKLRHLSFKQYEKDIESISSIFNDAWAANWRFEPLTAADTNHLAKAMRPILNEKLVWFVDVDGEPAGFGVCLPNINEAIQDLDGKLLPFGWAKLLWRLKVKGVKSARVPLMGIRRKYATGFVGAVLPFLIIDAMRTEARKIGYT